MVSSAIGITNASTFLALTIPADHLIIPTLLLTAQATLLPHGTSVILPNAGMIQSAQAVAASAVGA